MGASPWYEHPEILPALHVLAGGHGLAMILEGEARILASACEQNIHDVLSVARSVKAMPDGVHRLVLTTPEGKPHTVSIWVFSLSERVQLVSWLERLFEENDRRPHLDAAVRIREIYQDAHLDEAGFVPPSSNSPTSPPAETFAGLAGGPRRGKPS